MSDLNEWDKVLVISPPMFIGTVTGVYHWGVELNGIHNFYFDKVVLLERGK